MTHAASAIESGQLKPLQLEVGAERYADLYLILTDGELARPGVQKLAAMIKEAVRGAKQHDQLE